MKQRILLVDDHQLVLDGIRSMLAVIENIEVVGTANSGKDALRMLEHLAVDLVITDLDMPEMDGVQFTETLRSRGSDQKVLILSMHNDTSTIRQLIDIGANGYVLKTADQSEMLQAINEVLRGSKYFSADVTMKLLNPEPETTNELAIELTDREKEILVLIAEGYSNREIGERLFISYRTVDTHRTNLMRKIDVKNIAGLIRFALKHNLLDE